MSGEAPESGDKPPAAVPPPAGDSGLASHGHGVHIEFKFLNELRRRNVGRVAILYLVVWLADPRARSRDLSHAGGSGLG
jgi:hypothetical protein